MKAEPESRFENGIDVKFSIDDLVSKTDPEPWDGQFTSAISCCRLNLIASTPSLATNLCYIHVWC